MKDKLKKNNSEWAIFSLINNTKIENKQVVVWKFINGKKVTSEVYIRVIRKFRSELCLRGANTEQHEKFLKIISGSSSVNLYLPKDQVLFQSEIKSIDYGAGDIVVYIPKQIAQVDRRSYMRLFVEGSIKASVEFLKSKNGQQRSLSQKFDKILFDISAGGLSFVVSRYESKFFIEGDKVSKIKLNIGDKAVFIEGFVINVFDISPDEKNGLNYAGKKVCIKYLKLDDQTAKIIDSFVFKYVDLDNIAS